LGQGVTRHANLQKLCKIAPGKRLFNGLQQIPHVERQIARSRIMQKHKPRITCSLSSTKGGIQCMRAIAMSAAAALLPMPQTAVASPPSERVILRIWAAHSCDRRVMQNLTQHAHDVRETTSSPAADGQRLEQQN